MNYQTATTVKAILTNYRYYVLFTLCTAAIVLIFLDVDDTLPGRVWFYCLASTKIIGFTLAWILSKLVKRWERQGTIPELTNTVNNI